MDNRTIFLVTTFEKHEPGECFGADLGDIRTPCYRFTFESAEEVVKKNGVGIWETCYNYACIEEIEPCLYPDVKSRKFYKYNREINGYEEFDPPEYLKRLAVIGGIG